jgi:glycosyltransferase involved in cell wall biosynthesis
MTFAANTVSVPLREPIEGVTLSALLSDDELVAFFERTDLLVVPYLHADGLPLAVLEALNCGVPIIGFDSPSVGPLLRRHGQMVIAPDYAALRSAVEEWHAGRLTVAPPRAGGVTPWAEAFTHYINIIEAVGAPPGE